MVITRNTPIESAVQLQRLVQVAAVDPSEDPAPLVVALVYGGIVADRDERIRLATELLSLPQLAAAELHTLASGIDLSTAPERDVSRFVDALFEHHAAGVDVAVKLIYSHTDVQFPYNAHLSDPDNLAVVVAQATAAGNAVRTRSATLFIEYVRDHASADTLQQLLGLLRNGQWTESLWEAYQVASALTDVAVEDVIPMESDWGVPLEPVRTPKQA